MKIPVYLDYNATTPVDSRVLERMIPFFTEHFGNPSSRSHAYGWMADEAVVRAREQVAGTIGATPDEIFFTSGATESINLAIKGTAVTRMRQGKHIVTVSTEHSAVLEPCRRLERSGFRLTYLPVDANGLVDVRNLENSLTPDTILVSIALANNETGVIQPFETLSRIVRSRGIPFLTDATQAVGKIPVEAGLFDLLALSGHKVYGPKGTGALYVRNGSGFRPASLIDGGGQESGLRGGTLNVPGIVGLGEAVQLAAGDLTTSSERLVSLRDRFERELLRAIPEIRINGSDVPRLPQTSNVTFTGRRPNALLGALRDLAVSAGSACTSGTGRPSHVLKAMGRSDADALSSLRFSFGRFTTGDEITFALEKIREGIQSLPAPHDIGQDIE